MKRILITLLAIILCLGGLVSCNNTPDEPATTPVVTEPPAPPAPPKEQPTSIDVFLANEDGTYYSDYTIVYSARAADWVKEGAKMLQQALKIITGVELPIMHDSELDEDYNIIRNEKEILFGETNRSDEYTVPEEFAGYQDGFALFVAYERVVILPGSSAGAYFAVCDFIHGVYKVSLEELGQDINNYTPFKIGYDASMTLNQYFNRSRVLKDGLFPYLDLELKNFSIWHNGSYEQKRMAYAMRDSIKSMHGVQLPVITGETKSTDLLIKLDPVEERNELTLPGSNAINPGEWKVTFTGKTFNVQASTYYGFLDASRYFERELNQYGFFNLKKSGVSATGDYVDVATGHLESTKYAYDRQGEYRVMFLNVLFNNSASTDDGKESWSVPAGERNFLQKQLIAQYMPDVLGCQEFNWSKRGGANENDLAAYLTGLGYVETLDPRVKNALSEREGGWGTSGAEQVTVGDETFYTYYNHTPIFYNPENTKLLETGYYWYKNQWDKRPGSTHKNSDSDCGSKSATWAVFEALDSGERYIVVSTHMCTRSMYIRGLQAIEIALVIDELVAKYDCPVLFGGDMNGNSDDVNYIYFRSANYEEFLGELTKIVSKDKVLSTAELDAAFKSRFNYTLAEIEQIFAPAFEERANAAYKSLQDDDLATIYTSKTASGHGYPDLTEVDKIGTVKVKLMTPGKNNKNSYVSENYGGNSIDQVFVTNHDDVEFHVYGLVADNYAMSSSDHLPLFVDFSIISDFDTDDGDVEWGPSVID